MSQRIIRRPSILTVLILIIAQLILVSPAWAPPAPPFYDDFDDSVFTDGACEDGVLTADIDGNSGDTFLINTGGCPTLADGSISISPQVKVGLNREFVGALRIMPIDPPDNPPPNAVDFFRVETDGCEEADIGDAELLFEVDNKLVNVQLYALTGGAWVAVDISRVETGRDSSTYLASASACSDFAVVAEAEQVQTTDPDNLPYTSGTYLYAVGLLGLVFLVTGATIRIRATRK